MMSQPSDHMRHLRVALVASVVLLLSLCTFVLLSGATLSVQMMPRRLDDVVNFHLRAAGALVSNLDRERYEQDAMMKYIRQGDVVLNIGASVGTSCIAAEMLARGPEVDSESDRAHIRTFCVEPDPNMIPIMKQNFKDTKTSGIQILSAVVADDEHCPEGVPVLGASEHNRIDSKMPERLPRVLRYEDRSFQVEVCHTFDHIASLSAPKKMPSVIFGDCEGCLPSIYMQFRQAFASPDVRVVIYEQDGWFSGVGEAYKQMEDGLTHDGFRVVQVGWICVWQKGPLNLSLQVWVILLLLLIPWAMTVFLDMMVGKVLQNAVDMAPIWRIVVVFAVELYKPIGLGSWALIDGFPLSRSWQMSSWGRAGFHCFWQMAYLYGGLAWPAVRKLTQDTRIVAAVCWTIFSSAVATGYFAAEVQGVMANGEQPQHSIWNASLALVIALNIGAILARGTYLKRIPEVLGKEASA
mmetsp:Transcript_154946/g.496578  ORF Transcript_154946/g.496578 Transcript_154946/m.496578 type:complete len:466 (+) Transcript_154946:118-1515(+)